MPASARGKSLAPHFYCGSKSVHFKRCCASRLARTRLPTTCWMNIAGMPVPGRIRRRSSIVRVSPAGMARTIIKLLRETSAICCSSPWQAFCGLPSMLSARRMFPSSSANSWGVLDALWSGPGKRFVQCEMFFDNPCAHAHSKRCG